jgi:hypothetical protein
MSTREREVEGYLTGQLKSKLGLACMKFLPDNRNGMPDRLILLPGCKVLWVELKTVGGTLSPIQKLRHEELRRLGHRVVVVWDKLQADELVEELSRELKSGRDSRE